MKTKVCRKCKEEKSIKKFYRKRNNKDGYSSTCASCWREVKAGPPKVSTVDVNCREDLNWV